MVLGDKNSCYLLETFFKIFVGAGDAPMELYIYVSLQPVVGWKT